MMNMRRKHLLLIGWMIILWNGATAPVCAQLQTELDSLIHMLKTLPEDTAKVRVYGQVCYLYTLSRLNNELARQYADSVKQLSEKLTFEGGLFLSHYYYGMIDLDEGNYHEAVHHFHFYQDFCTKLGDSTRVGKALFGLGKAYSNLGDYEKSLAFYYRLVRIYEIENDLHGLANTTNSIGNIYRKTGKYKNAIASYKQANEIYKKLDLKKDYAMGLQNLGNAYASNESYDTALQYYEQALDLIQTLGHTSEKSMVLSNLGNLHEKLEQWEKALFYHLQALAIRRKLAQKRSLAITLDNVGRSYLKLNNPQQAALFLHEGLVLAEEIRSKDLLSELYKDLSELSVVRKDFEKAYHFNELSHQMKDSIFNEKTAAQINELQAKYETAEKDKQITLLAKEKEIQQKEVERQATLKRTSLAGLILVSMLTLLLIYISRQRLQHQRLLAVKNEEIKEAHFKQQLSELEMKALRAQINPHFLFNCMNSINRMILQGETDCASLYLTKFSKLVRLILENTEVTRVSLESELYMLEAYIQLEALRFKGKIHYQILVDESIERENTYLPAMVLQPFVENAIWHGLMHKEDTGMITIAVREEEDRLLCSIEDNGIGREKAQGLQEKSVSKQKSLGMKITEERLRLLSKERLEQLIRITDLKDSLNQVLGTRVDIMVPIA